ncbi:LysR family transcriptional regulator [Noviherbaspirillum saxi]|uniref:LysR family transcriptional regulator n=1 Tax=Noviherbaspirillum saxi TaxID=2320863 RepID=A0A3A3FI63_9BURK|nr:LysR family transcriptional regulator [Noviherbaspirillum saxi]RJF92078.1 LysR family transcriptional regulator [Noviherbaspirillum saxi]
METLNSIECFVRAAEAGSFSEAARRLGLTPAAVGKNVAKLEAQAGVRLFHRSTRSLALTEAGQRFLAEVSGGLGTIQAAIANLSNADGEPSGTLRVSMGNAFGMTYIVPLLERFLQRYPHISPDWHFDNRTVDLISENFDAAIGGGFDIPPGVVARELGPAHRVLVASTRYLEQRAAIVMPSELSECDGILVRSPQTGRVRPWTLRNRAGQQVSIDLRQHITMSDPDAVCRIAEMGLGIALTSLPHALPYLEKGTLVRVLPDWYVDAGMLALYFPAQNLMPAKTRAFVDFVVTHFREAKLAQRFSAIEA